VGSVLTERQRDRNPGAVGGGGQHAFGSVVGQIEAACFCRQTVCQVVGQKSSFSSISRKQSAAVSPR
jgi:hypothetical protein